MPDPSPQTTTHVYPTEKSVALWTGQRTQWVKALPGKPEGPSSSPRTDMVIEES